VSLTDAERRVCDAIGRDDLVELAGALVSFDTTTREVGDPPREEAALQAHLAGRLEAAGAEVDVWEPTASSSRASRWSRPACSLPAAHG
jgi:acetylornithine deacetylase/succinyl-diaminopimelate desuccinylase-like protein